MAEKTLDVPGAFVIAGCEVRGPVQVTFRGREVPRGWRGRLLLAFDLVFRPRRVERLYGSNVNIVGCVVTSAPGEAGIEVRSAA